MYVCTLFLSRGGLPAFGYMNRDKKAHLLDKLAGVLQALYEFHALHGDAGLRNMLYDGWYDCLARYLVLGLRYPLRTMCSRTNFGSTKRQLPMRR